MRREQLAGERYVGDVAAIGMNPLVQDEGRTAQGETLSRAGG